MFSLYSKGIIIELKQLSLKFQSFILTPLHELVVSLIPIHTFRQRRRFIENFEQKLNEFFRVKICSILVENVFGFYIYCGSLLLIMVSLFLSVFNLTPDNSSLFGVQILLLVHAIDGIQYLFRNYIQS